MNDRNHAPLFVWKKPCAINHLPGQAGVVVHAEIVETKSPKKKGKYITFPETLNFHCEKRLIALLPQLLPRIYL